jgi:glycosyltransferase involved in cell wall biosynthesis
MKMSVYITSYNQKTYLKEAIDSVLAQTRMPDEIVIVDDCSTDGSQELIREYERKHPGVIVPVLHARNMGIAQVRVDALKVATGDLVTYVDGDDRFLPRKLELEEQALLQDPGAHVAFSNHFYMTADGTTHTGCWVEDTCPPEGYVLGETFARRFPRRDLFRMELVRRQKLDEIGGHDIGLKTYEDFDWRIRLAKVCRVKYVHEPLAEIRCHGKGLSATASEEHLGALRKLFRKNRSLLCDLSLSQRYAVESDFLRWLSPFAREAAHEVLRDPDRCCVVRRLRALRELVFCARHAPDVLTLGDLYRILLPARLAVRLIDGPERAEQRSLSLRRRERRGRGNHEGHEGHEGGAEISR